jgi:transposase InsO family protein
MGIRDRPTAARSPWQNGYAERLIGSIRRECSDNVVVFGERHLRHLLGSYKKYYNDARAPLSLDKDAPVSRAIETVGSIIAKPAPRRTASSIRPELISGRENGPHRMACVIP